MKLGIVVRLTAEALQALQHCCSSVDSVSQKAAVSAKQVAPPSGGACRQKKAEPAGG
eukprot:CAMPEP_0175476084 /NCGR_PEP_ID=MMETSP0095-20121207/75745_1 /TAXON_ID=311494 /ORGANISM="Alexandrium monilatum, Strain CCMP3105" /LENGTH=56 /DNA_ID=CAMNT_0016777661 /DNA_START=103 /DNA_END=271 /DNA_ORIENTATION=-